jgi:hypothetical protein
MDDLFPFTLFDGDDESSSGGGGSGDGTAASGFGAETLTRIVIDVPEISVGDLNQFLRTSANPNLSIRAAADFIRGLAGGLRTGSFQLAKGAQRATAQIQIHGAGPVAGETFTVCGVTFTARASGASGNEFNANADPEIVAANIAAAVNSSGSRVADSILATSDGGNVTFTARIPGIEGNGFALFGSLSESMILDFSGGSNGNFSNYGIN